MSCALMAGTNFPMQKLGRWMVGGRLAGKPRGMFRAKLKLGADPFVHLQRGLSVREVRYVAHDLRGMFAR